MFRFAFPTLTTATLVIDVGKLLAFRTIVNGSRCERIKSIPDTFPDDDSFLAGDN
jgi:hypothetical protein